MAAPIDSDWANTNASDAALNATTHGSGTTAARTAITNWPANRPFFDTTLNRWFYNSHASAPTSVTWTNINLPKKRRFFIIFQFGGRATTSSFISPNGQLYTTADVTRTNAETVVTSEAFTVKRMRVRTNTGDVSTDFWKLYDDGTIIQTLNGTGAIDDLDSGDITLSVAAGSKIALENKTGVATTVGTCFIECEYDDIY